MKPAITTNTGYEPPISDVGAPMELGNEGYIWTGVRGYAVESNGEIKIPLIIADDPNNGDVGRFLDALSPRCVIVNVTNSRLQGMLIRRGWLMHMDADRCDEWRHTTNGKI